MVLSGLKSFLSWIFPLEAFFSFLHFFGKDGEGQVSSADEMFYNVQN